MNRFTEHLSLAALKIFFNRISLYNMKTIITLRCPTWNLLLYEIQGIDFKSVLLTGLFEF